MKVTVTSFCFNPFQENTFVLSDENKNCIIIDPGCYERNEEDQLLQFIRQEQLVPLALLNTHAHIDHVLGNQFIQKEFHVPYYLHREDLPTLHSVAKYAHLYGFVGYQSSPEPTHFLKDGDKLQFGGIQLEVFHTPGHAPGHVVFYNAENNFVINGDVLFKGSFGRVDLPGGDLETLKKSIFQTMFGFPDGTKIYCGHGEETSIELEKQTNYILQF